MNFQDLDIKISYKSFGEENIAKSFISPALKCAKLYQRSVGFFSSGVITTIMDGIVSLHRNGGKIQLIASPKLSEEDISAINLGYRRREEIINASFSKEFDDELESLDNACLQILADLIAEGTLDIKIAVTESLGDYHDKLGIMEDFDGNTVVFYGSANSSKNGYKNNYEKIRVEKSWGSEGLEHVEDEKIEFQSLWDGTNEYVKTYSYKESAQKHILEMIEHKNSKKIYENTIKLRDYQEEAINAWKNNNYHGFFVMATGTGKTWTALYGAKKLIDEKSAMLVICAPYKHLVKQWAEDVANIFKDAKIVLVSSENPNWENEINNAILNKKYLGKGQIVIISTIASFKMERFMKTILKSSETKILIVDEAHRFTYRPDDLKDNFAYMLGLSATPYSGNSPQKGKELMAYFGGKVYDLPIEEALKRGFLVPYNYYPIYVFATEDEESRFKIQTQIISSCFRNKVCINPDLLVQTLRHRLRIIAMAEEKKNNIGNILSNISEKDHFIVYCGDGRSVDEDKNEVVRHIQLVKRELTKHGFKASQFTASENITARMQLVEAFNNGEISALAAIRCLDEGINIPSIKSALILASNDDYREFVQRRGRILRLYNNKKSANIYDVIVLPSIELKAWAKIEFRRFYEYAKLAKNFSEIEIEFNNYLSEYDLSVEDVDAYDYDDMEEGFDE